MPRLPKSAPNMAPREFDAWLEQAADPKHTTLVCGKHSYVAGNPLKRPHSGCPDCWMAYYVYELAKTPPHKREERLEMLERNIRNASQLEDSRKFDFELFDHPQVSIEPEN